MDQQLTDQGSGNPYGIAPSHESPLNWLDPKYVQVEAVGGLILCAGLFFLGLVGLAVLWVVEGLGLYFYLALALCVLLVVLLLFFALLWPRISYRHYRWRLDDQSLEIHRGVLWRHRISIPLGRVQHADVAQGPLLRFFDLGSLIIHTAGTAHSMVQIDGLAHELALKLRDRLVQQAQSRNEL